MIFDASDNPATDPWATPKMPPHPTDFGEPRQTLAILWHLPRRGPSRAAWTIPSTRLVDDIRAATTMGDSRNGRGAWP